MNILSAITRHHARLAAASFLLRKHNQTAPYPKAERRFWQVCAGLFVAVVAIHLAPDDEYVLFIRLFIFNLFGFSLIVCMAAVAVLIAAGTIGQAVVEAYKSGSRTAKELDALPASDAPPAVEATTQDPQVWSYPGGKPRPYLTDDEKAAITAYPNPKLNLTTGSQIKAGFASGMSAAQIAVALDLSENLVRRYVGIFNRGKDAALSVEFE